MNRPSALTVAPNIFSNCSRSRGRRIVRSERVEHHFLHLWRRHNFGAPAIPNGIAPGHAALRAKEESLPDFFGESRKRPCFPEGAEGSESCGASRQKLIHQLAMHVGEAEVAPLKAVRQLRVVES